MDLIENPQTNEVFLDAAQFGVIYALDGTPYGKGKYQAAWPKVNHSDVPSLTAWARDPGKYSRAHYIKARLTNRLGKHFTAGGSFSYVTSWAKDNGARVILLACYSSRNVARSGVDVQW